MAIYVPASARRRNAIITAAVAAVVGLLLGFLLGRVTSPSLEDRVGDVQAKAREAASQLRVAALHEDESTGTEGNELALERAGDELDDALADASWIGASAADALRKDVDELSATSSGEDIEAVAKEIEAAFGLTS